MMSPAIALVVAILSLAAISLVASLVLDRRANRKRAPLRVARSALASKASVEAAVVARGDPADFAKLPRRERRRMSRDLATAFLKLNPKEILPVGPVARNASERGKLDARAAPDPH